MSTILRDLICANKTKSYAFDETLTNDLARGAFELYQCFLAIKRLFFFLFFWGGRGGGQAFQFPSFPFFTSIQFSSFQQFQETTPRLLCFGFMGSALYLESSEENISAKSNFNMCSQYPVQYSFSLGTKNNFKTLIKENIKAKKNYAHIITFSHYFLNTVIKH